jgi:hypothetical protein
MFCEWSACLKWWSFFKDERWSVAGFGSVVTGEVLIWPYSSWYTCVVHLVHVDESVFLRGLSSILRISRVCLPRGNHIINLFGIMKCLCKFTTYHQSRKGEKYDCVILYSVYSSISYSYLGASISIYIWMMIWSRAICTWI